MLPGIDGYQVCREIRKTNNIPIIMLSAKGETFDKVLGLELGADDYMIKPFETKELVARVKAVLRRYQQPAATSVPEKPSQVVEYPDLTIILDNIWGYEYIGDTRTVDVHIKRIREKIKDHAHWAIDTVWGIGYKFVTK